MADPSPQRAPDLEAETNDSVEPELLLQIADALADRHGLLNDGLTLDARDGDRTAWLRARIGPADQTWELELFTRDLVGWGLDGALGVLVDYIDGMLEEWLSKDREGWAPLDFEGRPYDLGDGDTAIIFVRGQVRDLEAEAASDRLLNDG